MKALRITGRGGPEVLRLDDVPDPIASPAELVVRVRAAGLNRADLLQCLGRYPAPLGSPPDIPGLEFAGEVEWIGAHVRRFKPGDRVMGIVGGGAFAERLVVHERACVRIPDRLSFTDAAAVPEALITAYDALVLQGGMVCGDTVLIHAAASGVGTAAVQLVAALGAVSIGTSRSRAKLDRAVELGLHHAVVVDAEPPRFAQAVLEHTGGRGADVVLDLVGGAYLPETIAAAAPRGRVLLVGLLAGGSAEISLTTVLQKRLRLIGTTLRARPLEQKIELAQAFEHTVVPLLDRGAIRPVVEAVHPFDQATGALGQLSSNATFGKHVLAW